MQAENAARRLAARHSSWTRLAGNKRTELVIKDERGRIGTDDLAAIDIENDTVALAVRCNECGATGPVSLSDDPAHSTFAWNRRMARPTVVKR